MHTHSIEDFRHSHVFLGDAHERNERKTWAVICICAAMMVAEIFGPDLLIVVGARKTFERFEVAIEPVDGGPPQRICVYGQIIDDIKDIGGLWQAKDILGESSDRSRYRPT